MSLFDDIFGEKTQPEPNLEICFTVWSEKQPFYGKLPKENDTVIKIKSGDFRKLAAAAYTAGFRRSKQ